MNQGRLIVFEGPDGVGKTTLSTAVARSFNQSGVTSMSMAFPEREAGTLGRLIYELHHRPDRYEVANITAASLQTLHAASQLDAIETRIKPLLEAGCHVFLDRFWWSTWVYGAVAGIDRRILRQIINLTRSHLSPIVPSVVFLLRRQVPIDRDEQLNCWPQLVAEYERLAQRERRRYRCVRFDNEGSIAKTSEQLLALLDIEGPPHRGAQENRLAPG